MIVKVTLVFGGMLMLCSAAVIKLSPKTHIVEGCKSETELWGSVDGTKFYFCIGDNQAIEQSCEPNTFFVKNSTVSGCIPVLEVSSNCVYHSEPEACEGIYLDQPQTHPDPTHFYFCPTAGVDPVPLACAEGKAFAKQDGWLGCFDWAIWRKIRACSAAE